MLIGRISGWFMLLFGVVLLTRYFAESADSGRAMPQAISDMFHGGDSAMLAIEHQSVVAKFSAAMQSGWSASLLILFGILLIWGCRRPKLR